MTMTVAPRGYHDKLYSNFSDGYVRNNIATWSFSYRSYNYTQNWQAASESGEISSLLSLVVGLHIVFLYTV